jgi:hypothetical protein
MHNSPAAAAHPVNPHPASQTVTGAEISASATLRTRRTEQVRDVEERTEWQREEQARRRAEEGQEAQRRSEQEAEHSREPRAGA